jgi:hypothetical protein
MTCLPVQMFAILSFTIICQTPKQHEMSLTEAFWNEVEKVLPDDLDRKQWLRVNGAGMSL